MEDILARFIFKIKLLEKNVIPWYVCEKENMEQKTLDAFQEVLDKLVANKVLDGWRYLGGSPKKWEYEIIVLERRSIVSIFTGGNVPEDALYLDEHRAVPREKTMGYFEKFVRKNAESLRRGLQSESNFEVMKDKLANKLFFWLKNDEHMNASLGFVTSVFIRKSEIYEDTRLKTDFFLYIQSRSHCHDVRLNTKTKERWATAETPELLEKYGVYPLATGNGVTQDRIYDFLKSILRHYISNIGRKIETRTRARART